MGLLDYAVNRTKSQRNSVRARIIAGDIPRWIENNKRRKYIKSVFISTPPWACRWSFAYIRGIQKTMNEVDGLAYSVDHIVPMNHPSVCGLTVPWNLRVVTEKENQQKSNSWCPEQLDMFKDRE